MKKRKITLLTIAVMLMCVLLAMPVSAAPKISKKKATMTVGQTLQLKVKGTKKKVKWSSNKKSVATVSAKGKVKAKKAGKATITAKVGKKKYRCKVTVKAKKQKNNSKGGVTYRSESIDHGAVIIAKNNYSYTVSLTADCIYYKNGIMVDKGSDDCIALEPGRECALFAWVYNSDWDSYKVNLKAQKSVNIIGNASKISVKSNFGNDNCVMAEVKNNGIKNETVVLAVVYYKSGKIVGYASNRASVETPGSVDYVELSPPYDEDGELITPDSYEIFVNYSIDFTD